MMPRIGDADLAFADHTPMRRHHRVAMMDLHPVGKLVERHRLPDQPFRHRIAIGIERDIAIEIDHPLKRVIHRRQHHRQGLQRGFLQHVGRFRRHPQRPLGAGIGHLLAPQDGLFVEIGEVSETACRQEIGFDEGEIAFDPPLAIRVADTVALTLTETDPASAQKVDPPTAVADWVKVK